MLITTIHPSVLDNVYIAEVRTLLSNIMSCFFVCYCVIVRFVDNGGIDDHCWLSFLFMTRFQMGNPISLFYYYKSWKLHYIVSSISILWAIQYLYSMGNPISLFYGQSNISILWAIQYLYFMGNPISLFYGQSNISMLWAI